MAKLVTNFGDMVTTGNTYLQQNLSVQGAFSQFTGNILAGSAYSTIGNASTKFNSIYATSINSTTTNTTSIYGPLGVVGVGTTPATGGASLQVQGNLFASNALQTPNVFATLSANTPSLNVGSIWARTGGLVGVGTATPAASFHVEGNVFASNALQTPNVFATLSANTPSLNVTSIWAQTGGLVGVGTATPGSSFHVEGNVFASNAFQAPNVFATLSANTPTLNVLSIFGRQGLVGIGTATPTATLHVEGNVFASNAFQVNNIWATGSVNAATINVTNIFGTTGVVGVGAAPVVGGATLQVQGNLFASNAIQTPNVFATLSANTPSLNVTSIWARTGGQVGVGTATPGASLHVEGNVFASNAFQVAGNIFAAGTVNVATMNVTNVYGTSGVVGIGTTPVTGGATLQIQGNLFATTAITTPNVFASLSANTPIVNTSAIFARTGYQVGIGTTQNLGANLHIIGNLYASNALTAPVANLGALTVSTTLTTQSIISSTGLLGVATSTPGANLDVAGNIWASNSVTTRNISATQWMNVATANIQSIYGPSGLVGVNTSTPGSTLDINGNLYVSTGISVANLSITNFFNALTVNVTSIYGRTGQVGINTIPVAGGATLQVQGNLYATNAIQTTNLFTANMNVPLVNTVSIFSKTGSLGIGTTTSGATLHVEGNLYVSNAIQTQNVITQFMNVPTLNVSTIYSPTGTLGIGTLIAGATLQVQGNLYMSNTIETGNLLTQILNVTSVLNTQSIFGPSSLVGIGTLTPGASLHVNGNLFASNSISTQNINATGTTNTALLNTSAIFGTFGNVGIGTSTGLWSTLQVQGNVWASNGIGAPSYTFGTANVTTLNVASITSPTGLVTLVSNLTSVTSNLAVSGNLTTANLTTQTLVYALDVTKQGAWLQANSANFTTILAWMGSTVNVARQTTTARVAYSNVAPGPRGSSDYFGSTLLVDGRVLFVPNQASNIGFFNPFTQMFSTVIPPGLSGSFAGGVLTPSGNVAFVPSGHSNVGLFNPLNYEYSNLVDLGGPCSGYGCLDPYGNVFISGTANHVSINTRTGQYTNVTNQTGLSSGGSVLGPSGNVYLVPVNPSQNVMVWNPWTFGTTNLTGTVFQTDFSGGVVTPTANIVLVPYGASNAVVLNPLSVTWSNVPHGSGSSAYSGGILAPTGNVIFVPYNSSNVATLDPSAMTISNVAAVPSTAGKFRGGRLVPDGRIVLTPGALANVTVVNTQIPVPVDFCRSPYFNVF